MGHVVQLFIDQGGKYLSLLSFSLAPSIYAQLRIVSCWVPVGMGPHLCKAQLC